MPLWLLSSFRLANIDIFVTMIYKTHPSSAKNVKIVKFFKGSKINHVDNFSCQNATQGLQYRDGK